MEKIYNEMLMGDLFFHNDEYEEVTVERFGGLRKDVSEEYISAIEKNIGAFFRDYMVTYEGLEKTKLHFLREEDYEEFKKIKSLLYTGKLG